MLSETRSSTRDQKVGGERKNSSGRSRYGTCAMCRGGVYFIDRVMYCEGCASEMFACECGFVSP